MSKSVALLEVAADAQPWAVDMSSASFDQPWQQSQTPGGTRLFWLAYNQVLAVLGVFFFLVFASHFIDFELKGVISGTIELWKDYARPSVGRQLHWLVSLLPDAWRFVIPPLAIDYFSVGLLSGAALLRALMRAGNPADFGILVAFDLALVLLWPILIPFLVWLGVFYDGGVRDGGKIILLMLTPLFYFGAILAMNARLV